MDKVDLLEAEIARLKIVVSEMTEALKIVTASDDRAQEFIARVEELLNK